MEHLTGKVKGLLTAKARISKRNTSIPRLEQISRQIAANMAKNVCNALKQLPIAVRKLDDLVNMTTLYFYSIFHSVNYAKSVSDYFTIDIGTYLAGDLSKFGR